MSGQAQVTSVESLEAYRSSLIVYLSQMHPAIEEVASEVARTKHWLEVEQRQFWETQLRQRRRKLEEAMAELFNAQTSKFQQSSSLQLMAVQRARRAVEEAEQKMTSLKRWARELETLADPLLKQVGQLQGYLSTEMGNAILYLTQVIQALAAYRDVLATNPPSVLPANNDAEITP